jgi:hypothetical protein
MTDLCEQVASNSATASMVMPVLLNMSLTLKVHLLPWKRIINVVVLEILYSKMYVK